MAIRPRAGLRRSHRVRTDPPRQLHDREIPSRESRRGVRAHDERESQVQERYNHDLRARTLDLD